MAAPGRPPPSPLALVAGTAGGAALLASALLPWSGRGAGSALALRRIGDLLLAGTVDALVPRWAGVVVYCVPLGGALVLVGTGLGRRTGALVASLGLVLALGGAAVCLLALGRLEASGVGGGTVAACGGAMLGTLGVGATWAGQRSSRQPPPPPNPPRGDPPP